MVVADDKLDAREAAPLQPETSSTTCRARSITTACSNCAGFYDRRDPRRDAARHRAVVRQVASQIPEAAQLGSANARRAGRGRGGPPLLIH